MNIHTIFHFAVSTTAEVATAIPWWTVVAGIIAIPVTILAGTVSYVTIKKTQLESRKIELEIAEKETALTNIGPVSPDANLARIVAEPLIEGRRVQEIILRFILLFLILQAWRVVEVLFDLTAKGVAAPLMPSGYDMPTFLYTIIYLVFLAFKAIPTIAYYLVLLGMGGPLLSQILRHLGVTPGRWISILESPKPWIFVLAGTVLLGLYVGNTATGGIGF